MNPECGTRVVSSLRALASQRVGDVDRSTVVQPESDHRHEIGSSHPHAIAMQMCGQRALAIASGQSVETVVRAIGHRGPMTLREMRTFFERHTPLRPTNLAREALIRDPAAVWWAFGAYRFLAVLVQFDGTHRARMGHAFVLEGRVLLDPDAVAGDVTSRVRPDVLGEFDYAFVLSAPEGGI